MVMTLRKRVASVATNKSESEGESERESVPMKKKARKPVRLVVSESESESESENDGAGYEKCREQRMRENRERMLKLGIFSLASQISQSKKRPPKTLYPKKPRNPPLFPRPPYEPRRSSRVAQSGFLENERSLKGMGIQIPDSWKPEIYNEEDEKLLGDFETPWTLNVEGFGEDGERLYDPLNGTLCHQCRLKTIQKHTHCSKCMSAQGQFCGDCLYTRYGENISEAMKNPSWLCPGCRGICNCSRCRRANGWPPVTILYSKVIESGFKSVAHYLILTRRGGNKPQESQDRTVVADLTQGETPMAPLDDDDDDCSDTSAEWSGSDSDDSDIEVSKPKKENSVDKEVDAITEVSSDGKEVDAITEVSSDDSDSEGVVKNQVVTITEQVDGELDSLLPIEKNEVVKEEWITVTEQVDVGLNY